jgi:hypothetical protein
MPVNISLEWLPAPVKQFVQRAETHLLERGPERLVQLRDDFTAVFSSQEVLQAILDASLGRLVAHMTEEGGLAGADSVLLRYAPHMILRLVTDPGNVTAFAAPRSPHRLVNYPANTLVLLLASQDVALDWYCLEHGASFDRCDSSLRIRHEVSEILPPFTCVHVDAARRFPVFTEREGNVYVVLSAAPSCAQIVSFEEGTLKPLGASFASEMQAIARVMLDLARQYRLPGAREALQGLARHHDHRVRWAAVLALGSLDPSAARERVREMARADPHALVRDAAQRLLGTRAQAAGAATPPAGC